MIRLSTRGEGELRAAARGLDRGPDHIRAQFAVAVRRATQPTLRDVKRAIETNPIRGFRTGARRRFRGPNVPKGLRRAIAATVDADIDAGTINPRVTFRADTEALGRRRMLPIYIEQGVIWRHPIMGVRSQWAGQRGRPWFRRNVERNESTFERALSIAARRVEQRLQR